MFKILSILITLGLAGCVTTPTLTNQYQTLGYNVNEYSDGWGNNYYEVFDQYGNLVSQSNAMGFIQWKRGKLLELIGNQNISEAERDRYKIEYEDIARRLDIYQNNVMQASLFKNAMRQKQINDNRQRTNEVYEARSKCIRAGGGYSCI